MQLGKYSAQNVARELTSLGSSQRAKASAWFFKTGKGQYGEGDVFVGVAVPQQRTIAKKYRDLLLTEIEKLLQDAVHECRLTALIILADRYKKSSEAERDQIAKFYLTHLKQVNNWDLVDSSAPYILGEYLQERSRRILYALARSKNLWERRIAIVATAAFIKNDEYEDTLKISAMLLKDKEDLLHKATGWMLREVGKRSLVSEEKFLDRYASFMPRTMLRYAIEKFPEPKRKAYLAKR